LEEFMVARTLGSTLRELAAICLLLSLSLLGAVNTPSSSVPPAKKKTAQKVNAASQREKLLHATQPGRRMQGAADDDAVTPAMYDGKNPWSGMNRRPHMHHMLRAQTWNGNLQSLPQTDIEQFEREEREGPQPAPTVFGDTAAPVSGDDTAPAAPDPALSAPAPGPTSNFDGLDFATWGNGHPPDTVGDVGPQYFIQAINTSVGIFNKGDGSLVTAFTFAAFMTQGHFGNVCDTNNFGDPVILYDSFEDRWVITDFAFKLDALGNVNPPHSFQCFAVSKSGDPVAGGWNFYSVETLGGLGDYPKFAIWTDGIYFSANMFNYSAGGAFENSRVFALNKAQMYAGAPAVQVVTFDAPPADFTVLPSNARLESGTPPPGSPNFFISSWEFLNALTVYKFHVDWNQPALSTFTGPDIPIAATSWPSQNVANAASLGGNALDVLQIRAMMQNQYSNIGGKESLWTAHTVRRATNGLAAPRWYQVDVTGGAVAPAIPQAATWDPDGANVINRFIPSLAVNRNGDLALGYSTSSATTKPAIKYAGRLAGDPINTFSQTEQLLVQGAGTQAGNCGGSACIRWGDYSAMSLDPNGCRFWYTNMYYKVDGLNHQTRIGSFTFPGCTPVGNGSLSGTVTEAVGGNPIAGATVALGSRTTTTDINGSYNFSGLPAGTYPSATASFGGFNSATATAIVVPDGGTAVQNFVLSFAATSACVTDTSKSDFLTGTATNCDLNTSPGDIILASPPTVEQNASLSNNGGAINATAWNAQTFIAPATGTLLSADINLFCSGCTGTRPNLSLSIRATSAGLPTGPDLVSGTIPGFSSGAAVYYSVTFATPITLTAGTSYALVVHPLTNPTVGTYAFTVSGTPNPYPNGSRVTSANAGVTWALATPARSGGFHINIQSGFTGTGAFVSSTKDANPTAGAVVNWKSLAWTAATPAGTSVQFQAAGSDGPNGPFNFVGPDGTAATFFGNGASLDPFLGKRYLRYRASLSTSSSAATPTLSDVTVCFDDVPAVTLLTVAPASGVYGGIVNLSANLGTGGTGLAGKTINFTLNGSSVGSGITDGTGLATLPGIHLGAINAGSYPTGVGASFGGDRGFAASTATAALSIAPAPLSVTAADAVRLYGQPNPAFTGLIVGILNGDNITATYATAATQSSPVGTYPIVPTLVDPDSRLGNYIVTSTNGTLTINPTPLTITANNASKTLNAPNPAFTTSYSGFVLGEGPAVLGGAQTCTTTAVTNSPVGSYPITCSGQTSANYTISYVGGTLSILYAQGGACVNAQEPSHQILHPINADGSSVFNGNGPIDVKFRVCDANGVSQSAPGIPTSITLTNIIKGTLNDAVDLPVDPKPGTTGFAFGEDQLWLFRIDSKALAGGFTYAFRVELNDGTHIDFRFGRR